MGKVSGKDMSERITHKLLGETKLHRKVVTFVKLPAQTEPAELTRDF